MRPPYAALALLTLAAPALTHGTSVSPISRVYRVYQSNPENPDFQLAADAVALDGTLSYYTWMEISRLVPEAVQAGLPPGFDYSPWIPDGEIASAGRTDPNSPEYTNTYAGLDQVSADWPTVPVTGGTTMQIEFIATAPHDPSVWDVWMTTPDWDASTALNWAQMEFLGRSDAVLQGSHYLFDVAIPADRLGHHVIWIAWQRDDPAGEAFFSTSDVFVTPSSGLGLPYCVAAPNSVDPGGAQIDATGSASVESNDLVLTADPIPPGQFGVFFHGPAQTQLPFGDGFRCVDGPLVRVGAPVTADPAGLLMQPVDDDSAGGAGIEAGAVRHFQGWYRDPAGGLAGFNLSNGLSVAFLP